MGPPPQGTSPVPRARLVTPNYAEAVAAAGAARCPGHHCPVSRAAAGQLSRAWQADAVAVTLGERGSVLVQGGVGPWSCPPKGWLSPTPAGQVIASPRGGGGARRGALTSEAVTAATAAAASYLAAGGAGVVGSPTRSAAVALSPGRYRKGPPRPGQDAAELARRSGRQAGPWSPRAAASTCCTPVTSACCRRPVPARRLPDRLPQLGRSVTG